MDGSSELLRIVVTGRYLVLVPSNSNEAGRDQGIQISRCLASTIHSFLWLNNELNGCDILELVVGTSKYLLTWLPYGLLILILLSNCND